MRKLLQNSSVVASLVVVAGLCVAANFIRWPKSAAPLNVAARFANDTQLPPLVHYPVRTPLRVEQALADWPRQISDTAIARDPFRRIRRATPPPTNSVVAAAVPPTLVVQGISIEAERAFAVINRRILTTGDRIDGYVVEQIQPTQVRVSGPAGEITLPVRPTATPKANPGAAK